MARASQRVVIVVDDSKMVKRLGVRTAIPVEVIPLAAPRSASVAGGVGSANGMDNGSFQITET